MYFAKLFQVCRDDMYENHQTLKKARKEARGMEEDLKCLEEELDQKKQKNIRLEEDVKSYNDRKKFLEKVEVLKMKKPWLVSTALSILFNLSVFSLVLLMMVWCPISIFTLVAYSWHWCKVNCCVELNLVMTKLVLLGELKCTSLYLMIADAFLLQRINTWQNLIWKKNVAFLIIFLPSL